MIQVKPVYMADSKNMGKGEIQGRNRARRWMRDGSDIEHASPWRFAVKAPTRRASPEARREGRWQRCRLALLEKEPEPAAGRPRLLPTTCMALLASYLLPRLFE